jgi:hypothetical protein
MIGAMKDRYSFLKTPLDNPFPKPNEGYKYENGAFNGKNGTVSITSVTIHDDGVVVETRSSTDDGDAFFEDAVNWSSKEFGLPPYSSVPIRKIYASELNVAFDNAPLILNPRLAKFLDDVSLSIGGSGKGNVDCLGFRLATDPDVSAKPAQFTFEREISTPFKENRYYSFATTTTDAHIKLLEKLEKLAT